MEQTQEMELVQQAQNGNEQALVSIYHSYLPPIYRFAYSHTGNQQVAEDIASEVFLKMVKQLAGFSGKSSFKNWLYAIAKHTVADYWRQHYRVPTTSLDMVREIELLEKIEPENIEQEIQLKEQKVNKILSNLPENYRRVLELRFIKCYSLQETADELKITLSNTKILQYRALKKACELSINI